ncbi:MAG: hypothetical protein RIC95_06850 [Vicingaceae bacterium]
MKQIQLKVILESDELVFRDLNVPADKNLEELHYSILKAFNFKGKEMASFLKTDDNWEALAEFTLEAISEEKKAKLMRNAKVGDVFESIGDSLSYIYDYLKEWKFELEAFKVEEGNSTEIEVIKEYGKAPDENEKKLSGEDAESILMNAILGDEFDEDEEDDLFGDGFESLDDYEEFQ